MTTWRRSIICVILLAALIVRPAIAATYFEDVGTEPHLLYSIWSVLLYDAERLDIPVPSNIDIIAYDLGLRGKDVVLSDEKSFYLFMESQDSQRLRDRMEATTRYEIALLLYDVFGKPKVAQRAHLYPSYVKKVRILLLDFRSEFSGFKVSAVSQMEALWDICLICEEDGDGN